MPYIVCLGHRKRRLGGAQDMPIVSRTSKQFTLSELGPVPGLFCDFDESFNLCLGFSICKIRDFDETHSEILKSKPVLLLS